MVNQLDGAKRLFVLDTNILMHDPTALFRFQEHDVYLPMVVLEELDRGKKGGSEIARNVRQTSRFIDELVEQCALDEIDQGIELVPPGVLNHAAESSSGRLFFQTSIDKVKLPESLPGNTADNSILATVLALQEKVDDVRLVTRDINLRIKASILGIHSEDYRNDKVLDDVDLLQTGYHEVTSDFWEDVGKDLKSWQDEGHTLYQVEGETVNEWMPGEFLADQNNPHNDYIIRKIEGQQAVLERVRNYSSEQHSVWGIEARNREQNYAMNLLMDPQFDFVTLLGPAGTGKTLLALAAGLEQTLEKNLYNEIIMTRITIPLGEDIGFLPGTEEEKMAPWMGALMDNLEVLTMHDKSSSFEREATQELINHRIKIRSMNFMRGRTFVGRYLIIDEAQNLSSKQIKALVTRAGPGTKIVCIGNLAQIDTLYLTETSSGLTYAVDRFKSWAHSGHVTLQLGERSRLSDYAISIL
ncbi:MAG: PhoH family protein [Gammaproteobacteria bacterium]|jgi:PhoH-like ATPase|nr:PhoH family protein [Gammaproteobacteria bacterium]MBT4607688.1 PhoH family protein [Thiotrichales bacterium]MBT3471450.1 PhoH family protein [Gammaproteobacteria bacterium]MBT3967221.1 PhoH family protein [Gammaproteobacteria bacterium]MBT4080178.1 PhoH family protein [Gammaproteobacteria bacterium]